MKIKKNKNTKDIIRMSFLDLLEEKKEVSNISVTDLAKKSNITRGTFYCYYDNIYDIAEEIEKEIQDSLFNGLNKIFTKEDINIFINNLFNYLSNNEYLFKVILKSNDSLIFLNRLEIKFNEFINNKSLNNKNSINIRICISGISILILKYYRNNCEYSLDYIKSSLIDILNKIL